MAKKFRLPSRIYRVDSRSNTVVIRDKKSGKLKGRKKTSGKGDGTRVRRIVKNFDVNKDGKVDYKKGEIVGRTPRKVMVKGSKRSRAFMRKI